MEQEILNQILTKITDLDNGLKEVKVNMATKAELEEIKANMATKAELEEIKANMATKAELEEIKVNMATKEDFETLKKAIESLRIESLNSDELILELIKDVQGSIKFINRRVADVELEVSIFKKKIEA